MQTFSLIAPVSIKVITDSDETIKDRFFGDRHTHKVNMFKNGKLVDRISFLYDGNQIVQYAIDLCKRYGKNADTIEIAPI